MMAENPGEQVKNGRHLPPEAVPHQFKPGQSGNPTGRPKGSVSLRTRLRRHLRRHPEDADAIVLALVEEAKARPRTIIEGDGKDKTVTMVGASFMGSQRLAWERHDGKVPEAIEIRGGMTHLVTHGVLREQDRVALE